MMKKKKICVIGAGVIGLSSAVRIQDAYPGIDITIIADTFSPYTTSDGSAGFWSMFLVSQDQEEETRKWGKATFDHILKLYNSELGGKLGAQLLSGYRYTPDVVPSWKDLLLSFRCLTEQERKLHPEHKFQLRGGKVEYRKLKGLEEVLDEYNIVINCSGLGAKSLFKDDRLIPIRGQVRRVYAPWIKHFIYDYNEHDGTETHILPGRDYVTVGGTADRENWDTELCTSNQEKIWQNARRLCPSLLNARLVGDLVGLRPGRDKIRLQMEDGPRGIKVVHNYGHGGSGISLHWGCAGEVVNLLKRAFQNETVTSKL